MFLPLFVQPTPGEAKTLEGCAECVSARRATSQRRYCSRAIRRADGAHAIATALAGAVRSQRDHAEMDARIGRSTHSKSRYHLMSLSPGLFRPRRQRRDTD